MQAEGESAWSEGLTMPASVPCRSRESVELGNHAICEDPVRWTADSEDHLFQQSDNTWTAFTQDSSAQRQDVMGQWWPTSAVEERVVTNQNVVAVFAEAFPSLPGSSSSDPCDLGAVSTLTQILREKASQEKGLLDSFHDLNKIICQRFTKANGISSRAAAEDFTAGAASNRKSTYCLDSQSQTLPWPPNSPSTHSQCCC
ncbi:hypothetical protein fugu_010594 [Takifugu bimaculatus]|uniref:Aftiphilin clathrin-binding box domain-containing protein n=1 Tax=Takifugu bimaculatus TaxID=433685 RepID=A0A4Z2CAE8_9TELE|nr:hypothetical protein fugu_010594 [Takifugu bimaculatus]